METTPILATNPKGWVKSHGHQTRVHPHKGSGDVGKMWAYGFTTDQINPQAILNGLLGSSGATSYWCACMHKGLLIPCKEASKEPHKGSKATIGYLEQGTQGKAHKTLPSLRPVRRRPTPGARRNHRTLAANLRWETQSQLARDQPWAGDAVMTCSRPTSTGRCTHDSPKTNLGQETHSRLARGQPRAGDVVMTRLRPISSRRCSHDSPETNLRWKT
jgi:hypothetical protein